MARVRAGDEAPTHRVVENRRGSCPSPKFGGGHVVRLPNRWRLGGVPLTNTLPLISTAHD